MAGLAGSAPPLSRSRDGGYTTLLRSTDSGGQGAKPSIQNKMNMESLESGAQTLCKVEHEYEGGYSGFRKCMPES